MIIAVRRARAGALNLIRPGIATLTPARVDREAAEAPRCGGDDHGPARSASAAAVAVAVDPAGTVDRDRRGPGHTARADQNDPAAGAAAAQCAGAVVPRGGAPASPEDDPARRRGKEIAAEASPRKIGVPGVAALASDATVSAATASRIAVVLARPAVRAAAAGIARRAPRHASVRIALGARRHDGVGRRIEDPGRCACDSFALRAVEVRGGRRAVVGVVAPVVAAELKSSAAAESEPVQAHRSAAEIEGPQDVEHEDSPRGAVPRARRQARSQSRRGVLRNADDLKSPLSLGTGGGGVRVGVQETAAHTRALNRERASGKGNPAGGLCELVEARAVQVRRSAADPIAARSVAVGVGVVRVDRRVLHLDEEKQVARRDRRRSTRRGAERDRRRARRRRGRRRMVGIDDAREGSARAVLTGCGADLSGRLGATCGHNGEQSAREAHELLAEARM